MNPFYNFYTLYLQKTPKTPMKKILLLTIIAAAVVFSSCVKDTKCSYQDSTIVASAGEQATLKDSLDAHGITNVTKHPSGFYYTIVNQGAGPGVVNLCSNITADYKGSFFNGVVFDSTKIGESFYIELGRLIPGWQKGIPLVNKGGDINLYIPPSLAYGPNNITDNSGKVVIPGNSYLKFAIHIVNIEQK